MLLFARRQKKVVKILIADDHKILREGIKNVLEMESDFEVVGEAGNGEEVYERFLASGS